MWPASVQRRIVASETPRYSAAWELVKTSLRSLAVEVVGMWASIVSSGAVSGAVRFASVSSHRSANLSAAQLCGRFRRAGGRSVVLASSDGARRGRRRDSFLDALARGLGQA